MSSLGTREIGDSGYLSQATGTGDTQAALTPQHAIHPPSPLTSSLPDLLPQQALLVPHSPSPGLHSHSIPFYRDEIRHFLISF